MKPALFNTEMVKGLLSGHKTVTRRVVKPQPREIYHGGTLWDDAGDLIALVESQNGRLEQTASPYRPGDILYVRETWKQATCDYAGGGYGLQDLYLYKADGPIDTSRMMVEEKWHPSIHMPKEAARLFLRVTDVRVERLQDITEEQARAEGIRGYWAVPHNNEPPFVAPGVESDKFHTRKEAFGKLWDSTIKPKDIPLYGWEANPWVWVIEFERVSKPKEV